jgi:hypothetical protein
MEVLISLRKQRNKLPLDKRRHPKFPPKISLTSKHMIITIIVTRLLKQLAKIKQKKQLSTTILQREI